jgi:hypothetical protein
MLGRNRSQSLIKPAFLSSSLKAFILASALHLALNYG